MILSSHRRAGALAFVTAFATLFLQVLLHRMVSVKLLNNYAFLIISMTMLGFAISGVVLARFLPRVLDHFDEVAGACAALFALAAIVISASFYRADASSQGASFRPDFVVAVLSWLPVASLFALPFAFLGTILGALLAAPGLPAGRIYFADLVGSALGAFAVIPAISWLGVERAAALACALSVVATAALAWPKSLAVRGLCATALIVSALAAVIPDRIFELRYPQGSMLAESQQPGGALTVEHTQWDPLARIEVSRIQPPDPRKTTFPALIGDNAALLARIRLVLTQNNFAFTYAVDYDGNPQSLKGIERTIYAAAYEVRAAPRPKVAIVGVGGGFDVLEALAHDASEVWAAEINGATVDILRNRYREYFRHWVDDPRVHLLEAEGRSFLTSRDDRFDVIQLSGVDSYSGTPGAAHVFSESYLYTAEAFDLYLSRLADNGVLNVMRLEHRPPREMLRVLVSAIAALRRSGVQEPARHIAVVSAANEFFVAVLVKKTPFTPQDLQHLSEWVASDPLVKLIATAQTSSQGQNLFQVVLGLTSDAERQAYVDAYPFDLSPAEDDRPFFFRQSFWWHIFPRQSAIWAAVPAMEYTVLLLVLVIGLIAVACVLVPLKSFAAAGLRVPGAGRYLAFFGGTGVGYMAIEVGLLQKYGLLLGHPNFALSVVLATMLLSTGIGSLVSPWIVRGPAHVRGVSYALAAVLLLEYALLFPHLSAMMALPLWVRVLITAGAVFPVGLALGTFVPVAIEATKLRAPRFVPWAWGINGVASVLAPVLSVAVSMSFGISALLLSAIPIYLLVGLTTPATELPPPGSEAQTRG